MTKKKGVELLREPFEDRHVGKLPKPTKSQTKEVKDNFKAGVRCDICGGWHHPKVVHLDYVGHAALTDRLLDADINWFWEPLAFNEQGLPAFDSEGGLWIRLTVGGVSRLGYGNAEKSNFKEVGSREKEVIGDALRNAAMRFGAALDLWHKGDLHDDSSTDESEQKKAPVNPKATTKPKPVKKLTEEQLVDFDRLLAETDTNLQEMLKVFKQDSVNVDNYQSLMSKLQKKHATMQATINDGTVTK
ncbi:hypothetical protein OAF54_01745 [bacterium]|nr:hypothetical protein [bacterium]